MRWIFRIRCLLLVEKGIPSAAKAGALSDLYGTPEGVPLQDDYEASA